MPSLVEKSLHVRKFFTAVETLHVRDFYKPLVKVLAELFGNWTSSGMKNLNFVLSPFYRAPLNGLHKIRKKQPSYCLLLSAFMFIFKEVTCAGAFAG
ncbi:MAG: hypothetical protein N3D14_01325 [Aquificaceae bacterium]|nr:hypothetical protein [Aquificaceae bacterium]MCX8164019.1 hypothetical protein [Aquificaceae bacterium]